MRIRLLLEYDGTEFSGWQFQPDQRTVQGVLELALEGMMGAPVNVVGSGRTDAGVHALGQVAHCEVPRAIRPDNIALGLNSALPRDVRVLACTQADPSFHAQRSALGKHYRYLVLNRKSPTALMRHRVWHIWSPLDLSAMREGAEALLGRRDFAAFKSAGDDPGTTVRDLRRLSIGRDGDMVALDFEADGFLKHMVRNITGALVMVGTGRLAPSSVKALLESRSREDAPRKAPPQGLTLMRVFYP